MAVATITPPTNLVHIRWMIRRDLKSILQIEKYGRETFWKEDDFLKALRRKNAIGMVAERFNTVVGFVIYELHNKKLRIENLAVHPEWRRSRIGTQMVTQLKRKLHLYRRTTLEATVRDTNLDSHLFFKFNEMKARVLRNYFVDELIEGPPLQSDGYCFKYQTNGEDFYD